MMLKNIAQMKLDGYPDFFVVGANPDLMSFTVMKAKTDVVGNEWVNVQQSNSWYREHGYERLNESKSLSFSTPMLQSDYSNTKCFLPSITAAFGISSVARVTSVPDNMAGLINEEGSNAEAGDLGPTLRAMLGSNPTSEKLLTIRNQL